mgnify:CR=1 FL=1
MNLGRRQQKYHSDQDSCRGASGLRWWVWWICLSILLVACSLDHGSQAPGDRSQRATTASAGLVESSALATQTPATSGKYYPVVDVLRGDALRVRVDGRVEVVHLIGVQAPSLDQCYGDKAQEALRSAAGEAVKLETDPSLGVRDSLGEMMAYVWNSRGEMVNVWMLSHGYARIKDEGSSMLTFEQELQAAMEGARKSKMGMWNKGACPTPGARLPYDYSGENVQSRPVPATMMYVDGTSGGYVGANLRLEPTTRSKLLMLIPNGEAVSVLSNKIPGPDGDRWYKVRYGNLKGWIRSDLLVRDVPGGPPSRRMLVDASPQGYAGANLRAKPSMQAPVITLIPNRKLVLASPRTVLGIDGYYWYGVRYGRFTGWIRSDLLLPPPN